MEKRNYFLKYIQYTEQFYEQRFCIHTHTTIKRKHQKMKNNAEFLALFTFLALLTFF